MPQQPYTAVLMHATSLGKYQIFSSFAQKTSNMHKNTVSKPSLSSKDATFKTVSHFKGSSAWTIAHFWVCSAAHVLTPIAVDALHPKNAIQAEIPTSAVHWATAVLCSTPLKNWKLEQFIFAECPKRNKDTKWKDTTLNGCDEMRTAESEPGVFFFFFFCF